MGQLEAIKSVAPPLIKMSYRSALKRAAEMLTQSEKPLKVMCGAPEGKFLRDTVILVMTDQRVIVLPTSGRSNRQEVVFPYAELEAEGERAGLVGAVVQWVPGAGAIGALSPGVRLRSPEETVVIRHLEPAREVIAMMRTLEDQMARHRPSGATSSTASMTGMGAARDAMGALSALSKTTRDRFDGGPGTPAVKEAPNDQLDDERRIQALGKLADLHERGALTDEEYESEKRRLLRED